MKTIKILLIALTISLTNIVSANNNPAIENPITKAESSIIIKEISALLVKPNFKMDNELTANVTFMANKNNEIIVLKVDTVNKELDKFIKTRLNYHSLSLKLTNNKAYELKVRLVVQ